MSSNLEKIRVTILSFVIILVIGFILFKNEDPWVKKARIETAEKMSKLANTENKLKNWPPVLGNPFPNIELLDHQGNKFDIENLKGKPTLIEIVTMTCAGCQAFSGGHKLGTFGGMPAQEDLGSIEEYYRQYTYGHELFSNEINFVQIIIYNLRLEAATIRDVGSWRKHFQLDKHQNTFVLTGGEALATSASLYMIPGFILLDKDITVLFDSTGHNPKHSLYLELLPAMYRILENEN